MDSPQSLPDVDKSGYRVEMLDIKQRFGDTTVLHGVSLQLKAGEIHSLVGQNGAGKSTLMKILGGIYPDHGGRILIDGVERRMHSPREAGTHGVGTIYQELSLIPGLSVAENIVLGMETGLTYSPRRTRAFAAKVIATVPMLSVLPLDVSVGSLSTGMQQRVEIAKALSRDLRVLVMDEPTARLSGPERDDLRNLVLQVADKGITVIYISHFLEEIFATCHNVTVLRNGRVVTQGSVDSFTPSSLTRVMLGEVLAAEELDAGHDDRLVSDTPVLQLIGVTGPRITDVDLSIRKGEVVGLAGLVGSGRTRLAKTVVGAEPIVTGDVVVGGSKRTVRFHSPRDALRKGIVMIPENRKTEGIIGSATARSNMVGMALDRGYTTKGLIRRKALRRATSAMFAKLEIRPTKPELDGRAFSGGNQQKLLMARALLASPDLIVADQPTAGVDVGTKSQIHHLIAAGATAGTSFLVVSDDLEELLALCDRVLVLRHGRIIAERRRSELNRQKLVDAISSEDQTDSTGITTTQ